MKNQFSHTFEKTPKTPINGEPIELIFENINQVHQWANGLKEIMEFKPDLALLHFAINRQQHIKGDGCVPIRTCKKFGADTVVVLNFEPNRYKVRYGIMTPEMARVFNR